MSHHHFTSNKEMARVFDDLEVTKLQLKHILTFAPYYSRLRSIRGEKYLLQRVITLREASLQELHLTPDHIDYFFIRILKIFSDNSYFEIFKWIYSLELLYDCKWALPDAQCFLNTCSEEKVNECKAAFLNVFGSIPDNTQDATMVRTHWSLSLRIAGFLLPGQEEFTWHPPRSWSCPVVYVENFEEYLRSTWGSSLLQLLALNEDQVQWWNAPTPPLTGYLADQLTLLMAHLAAQLNQEKKLPSYTGSDDLQVSCAVEDLEIPEVPQDAVSSSEVVIVVLELPQEAVSSSEVSMIVPEVPQDPVSSSEVGRKVHVPEVPQDTVSASSEVVMVWPEVPQDAVSSSEVVMVWPEVPQDTVSSSEVVMVWPEVPQDAVSSSEVGTIVHVPVPQGAVSTSEVRLTKSHMSVDAVPSSATGLCRKRKLVGQNDSYEPECKYYMYDDETSATIPLDYESHIVDESASPKPENVSSTTYELQEPDVTSNASESDYTSESDDSSSAESVPDCTGPISRWDPSTVSDWDEDVPPLTSQSKCEEYLSNYELQLFDKRVKEMSIASPGLLSPGWDVSSLSGLDDLSFTSPSESQDDSASTLSNWDGSSAYSSYSSDMEINCNPILLPLTPPTSSKQSTPISSAKTEHNRPSCSCSLQHCVYDHSTDDEEEQLVNMERARQVRRVKKQVRRLKLHVNIHTKRINLV